jgi:hypothetical protein
MHIGHLAEGQKLRIQQHLDELGYRIRFLHKEYVPHLASALCELAPCVYIDSYPVGGGRAIIEAMAAGLPICASNHDPNLDSSAFCYPERFSWRDPAELRATLAGLDPTTLEHHAALSRTFFEQNHSPRMFKERLQAILN